MSAEKLNIRLNIKGTHLQDTLNELAKQKSEQMQQKIERALQKQKHIIQIENELEQRLRRKNQQILDKLNKSVEAKKKIIDKKKEKVHIKIKFETEKSAAHRKKEQSLANRSWRQSVKLAQWVNNRNLTRSNRFKSSKVQRMEQIEEGRDKVVGLDQLKLSQHLPNINGRKKTVQQKKHAEYAQQQHLDYSRSKSENDMQGDQMNRPFSYLFKMKQLHHLKEEEGINNFNMKLRKLEQARMKKQKLQRQKQKKIHDLIQLKVEKIVQKKKSQKKSQTDHQRTKTEGNSHQVQLGHSNKRQVFKKWEEDNKVRQLELFEIRLRKGEDYMMNMKDKSMRNKIDRQLQMSTIQKKLYIQRKSLHELSKSAQKID